MPFDVNEIIKEDKIKAPFVFDVNKIISEQQGSSVIPAKKPQIAPQTQQVIPMATNIPQAQTKPTTTQPAPYETPYMKGTQKPLSEKEKSLLAEEMQPIGKKKISFDTPAIRDIIKAGKFADERYRQPIMENITRFPSIAIRKAQGKIPTPWQVAGLYYNDKKMVADGKMQIPFHGSAHANMLQLYQLARDGKMPTKGNFRTEMGEKRANDIIEKLEQLSGLNPFSYDAHWFSLGGIRDRNEPIVPRDSEHPTIKGISQLEATTKAIVEEVANFALEETTDPIEWVFDAAFGAIGSRAVKGLDPSLEPFKEMMEDIAQKSGKELTAKEAATRTKEGLSNIRKRAVETIKSRYKGKQAQDLIEQVTKMPDDEILGSVAKTLDELVDWEVSPAQVEAIPKGKGVAVPEELIPEKTPSLDDIFTRTQLLEDAQSRRAEIMKQPKASVNMPLQDYVSARTREGYTQDVAIGQYMMDAEQAIANGQPVHADVLSHPQMKMPEGYIQEDDMLVPVTPAGVATIPQPQAPPAPIPDVAEAAPSLPDVEIPATMPQPEAVTPQKEAYLPDKEFNKIYNEKGTNWFLDNRKPIEQKYGKSYHDLNSYDITQAEYVSAERMGRTPVMGDSGVYSLETAIDDHKAGIIEAIERGEVIRADVLADYPDLAKVTEIPPIEVEQVVTNQAKSLYKLPNRTMVEYDAVNGEGSAVKAIQSGIMQENVAGDLEYTQVGRQELFGTMPVGMKTKLVRNQPAVSVIFDGDGIIPENLLVEYPEIRTVAEGKNAAIGYVPYENWQEFSSQTKVYKSIGDFLGDKPIDVINDTQQQFPDMEIGAIGVQKVTKAMASIKQKGKIPVGQSIDVKGKVKASKPQRQVENVLNNVDKGLAGHVDKLQNVSVKDIEIAQGNDNAWLEETVNNIRAALAAEPHKELVLAEKKYGGELGRQIRQFRDDMRTKVTPASIHASNDASIDIVGIYRDLDKEQLKDFWDTVAIKTNLSNYDFYYGQELERLALQNKINLTKAPQEIMDKEAMATFAKNVAQGKIPKGFDPELLNKANNAIMEQLSSNQRGVEVIDAIERYKQLMGRILESAKEKGFIKDVEERDFYFHRELLKYYQDYNSLPPRAKKAYRKYMKRALGGDEDVVINENVLKTYLTQYHLDDRIDAFTLDALEKLDVLPQLQKTLTPDDIVKIFGGDEPKPGSRYNIQGKSYLGYQYQDGRQLYKDIKSKLGNMIEDANAYAIDNPDATIEEVMDYLKTLVDLDETGEYAQSQLIMGKRHKVYLIPEPTANVLSNLNPRADNLMRWLQAITQKWKSTTLLYAGAPYQIGNIFGDWENMIREVPEIAAQLPGLKRFIGKLTVKYDPNRLDIINNLLGGTAELTDFEQRILEIAIEKDVLGGSGMVDLGIYGQDRGAVKGGYDKVRALYHNLNFRREAAPRLAMLMYQMDRVDRGLPLKTKSLGKAIAGLDQVSGAAYIARNAGVDYLDAPLWYRRYMNGALMPFLTFRQKNAYNWARYWTSKKGLPAGLATLGTGYAATYYWNTKTSKARRNAYASLPPYLRERPGLAIIRTENEIGDDPNLPTSAVVFAPQMPDAMAAELLGIGKLINYAKSVEMGLMTPREAVKQYLDEYAKGEVGGKFAQELANPLAKALTSLGFNKDLYTGQPIYPEDAVGPVIWDYKVGYVLKALVTPMAQFAYDRGTAEGFKVSDIIEGEYWEQHFTEIMGPMIKGTKGSLWDKALAQRGPLAFARALGFYRVDLLAEKARQLEYKTKVVKWEQKQQVVELADKFIDAVVQDNIKPFAEELMSGKYAPNTVAINGIDYTTSPQEYYDALSKNFNRTLNNDKTIKNFLAKWGAATGDKREAKKIYSLWRYTEALNRISNMPNTEQLELLPLVLNQFDYGEPPVLQD